jgi:hypothetical protein
MIAAELFDEASPALVMPAWPMLLGLAILAFLIILIAGVCERGRLTAGPANNGR